MYKNTDEKKFNENQVEGRNAVLEVFKSGRDIEKIIVAKGNTEGTIRRIMAMAADKGVVLQQVERKRLDEMSSKGGLTAMFQLKIYWKKLKIREKTLL